ncbi:hypothetical protein Tco_0411081 [Tanacetum coccineum]
MTTSKLPSLIGKRSISKGQVTVTGSRLLLVAGPLFLQFLSAFLTQGTVSNIPIVFSWSDSIRPEGFLSSVLLWLVIIVAVVGVGVTVVVVVESSSVVKLSFSLSFRGGNIPFNTSRQSPDENFHHFLRIWHHSRTLELPNLEIFSICLEIIPFTVRWQKNSTRIELLLFKVPVAILPCSLPLHFLLQGASLQSGGDSLSPVFLLVLSAFAIVAACVSRAAVTLSATSFLMAT